ncbi:GNAT family N-acetyltransferase [Alkalicoccobacillus gibsonii]|uniref:GNAT family N-acetyltransferase n=1 Tax=Alkalicoccobacillus gibsonii TaxID=79881 RepID=A0ABU9VEJ0_9BACI
MTKQIELIPVPKEELKGFKEELKEAFLKGLKDSFDHVENAERLGPIPSDEDFEQSVNSRDSVVRQLMLNGEKIGGVVLTINERMHRNEVSFLYTVASAHGKGLGTQAWHAIEAAFPSTKVWELHTPYFEKRNIHFYVNKCGFKIVEFYHRGNPGPHEGASQPKSDEEYEFFRFEKVISSP